MLIFKASLCAAALLSQTATTTPATPDFSGRWELVEPSDGGSQAARELTVTRTGAVSAASLTIKRSGRGGVQTDTYRVGRVAGGIRPDGVVTRVAAQWDGTTLQLESGTYPRAIGAGSTATEHQERWSLNADGRLVIDVTDRRPGSEPTTAKLLYRKRQ